MRTLISQKNQITQVEMGKKQCFLHDTGDVAEGLGRDERNS